MNEMQKYRQQFESITFSPDFEQRTVQLMAKAAKEKELATMKNRKLLKIIIAAAAAVVMLTTTAFALSALLSPEQVAEMTGQNEIAEAFRSEDAVLINEAISAGDYTVTLLGMTSGQALHYIDDMPVEVDRSYIVVSVERNDGTPIDPFEEILAPSKENSITFSPLVEGWAPHHVNAWSLSCGAHGTTVDGIRYYLFDYSNLEIFADHTVYLAIYEGMAPSPDIFTMAEDGTISYAEEYEGVRAMFILPLDPSKADPEAATQLLIDQGILNEDGTVYDGAEEDTQDEFTAQNNSTAEADYGDCTATTATAAVENIDEALNAYIEAELEIDSPAGSGWVWPVDSRTITRFFGPSSNPARNDSDHIVIVCNNGDKVVSAISGSVTEVSDSPEYGNYIVISGEDNIRILYGHLSEITVTEGQSVAAGDRVGSAGATGNVTGICLSFYVYINDETVDPLGFYA